MKNSKTPRPPRAILALGFAFCSAAALAQIDPAFRIGELLRNSAGFAGQMLPRLGSQPVRAPSFHLQSAVPDNLWSSLPTPDTLAGSDADAYNQLASMSGFSASNTRVLTFHAADAMLSAAADQQRSALDFFTDASFRDPSKVYYMTQSTIEQLFAKYDLHVPTPQSGDTPDEDSPTHFTMIGLAIGNGRIDNLYDHDHFEYNHPLFEYKTFRFAQHVVERIQGASDVAVEGMEVYVFGYHQIQRVTSTSVVVDGNTYAANPTTPIRRR